MVAWGMDIHTDFDGRFSLRAITKDASFLHVTKKFTRTLVP